MTVDKVITSVSSPWGGEWTLDGKGGMGRGCYVCVKNLIDDRSLGNRKTGVERRGPSGRPEIGTTSRS